MQFNVKCAATTAVSMTCPYFYNFPSIRNVYESLRLTLTHPPTSYYRSECAHYYSNRFPFLHKMYTFISRKVKMFRLIWVRLVRFAKVRNCLVLVLFHCLLLLLSNLNPFPILHFNVKFAYLSALFSIYSPFNSIQFNSLLNFCFVSGKEHVKLHQKSNNYAQNGISFIAQLKTVNSCNSCL